MKRNIVPMGSTEEKVNEKAHEEMSGSLIKRFFQ